MIRRFLQFIIIVVLLISIGGYFAIQVEGMPTDYVQFYNQHFGFVTGLCSVIGLLSFGYGGRIKSTDFEAEQLEQLKSIIDTAKEVENLKESKTKSKIELEELNHRKAVLAVSIERAAKVLFYKNQLAAHLDTVNTIISENKALREAVSETIMIEHNLTMLNEDIEKDENMQVIKDILIRKNKEEMQLIVDPVELIWRAVNGLLRSSFGFPRK